jgi:AraC family transcriptional regulator
MAPHDYVLAARLEQARKLLPLSELPIARTAADSGFASQSHFTAQFREAHAVTPVDTTRSRGNDNGMRSVLVILRPWP